MQLEITIPGEPVSQPRARAAIVGGHARMYSPKGGSSDYKATIRLAAAAAFTDAPLKCPMLVDCEFVFRRPKGHFRTGRHAAELKPTAPLRHTTKPDIENVAKAVLDALSGVVWHDDRQVSHLTLQKWYVNDDEQPHTKIMINCEP